MANHAEFSPRVPLKDGEPVEFVVVPIRQIHFKPDSSWGVYEVRVSGEVTRMTIEGIFVKPLELELSYHIKGIVKMYRGREQIRLTQYKRLTPTTKSGMVKFLKTLPGISTTAERIYDEFGASCLDVLRQTPELACERVKGLKKHHALSCQQHLNEQLESEETLAVLLSYDLRLSDAKRLLVVHGESVIQRIAENPYQLAGEGITFHACDHIAQSLGMDRYHYQRIEAGLIETLNRCQQEGHCYLPQDEFWKKTITLLGTSPYPRLPVDALYQPALQLVKDGKLLFEQDRFYLPTIYEQEKRVAQKIVALTQAGQRFASDEREACLNALLLETGYQLEEAQREACLQFNETTSGFYVLNGSAGTGKTFTVNLVAEMARRLSKRDDFQIMFLAPTGRAAKVLSRSTKQPAYTIHRALCYDAKRGVFQRNESDPFTADVLIVDETSMLDLSLSDHLLRALKLGIKVIFMGDIKQLPSIRAGNVLRDLILSGVCPVVTLTVVKRQGLLSGILENAIRVAHQLSLVDCRQTTQDAIIVPSSNALFTQQYILQAFESCLAKGFKLGDIQVLSAKKDGLTGTRYLNYLLQQTFLEKQEGLRVIADRFSCMLDPRRGSEQIELYFRQGDKVMHSNCNRYEIHYCDKLSDGTYVKRETEDEITNGTCGIIDTILTKENVTYIVVQFEDGYLFYNKEEWKDLQHAYCLTIHKSQGSGWGAVIIPIMREQWYMLENNLIYTAITRAEKWLTIIGEESAVTHAIQTVKSTVRHTTLAQRLQEEKQRISQTQN